MRKNWTILLLVMILLQGCANKKETQSDKAIVITKGLRFCEGSVAYGSHILISNFGTEALNPLNNERKGYISIIKDNNADIFISRDGFLSGPKGMAINDDLLFIADVAKVLVYNLKDKQKEPQVIHFPIGNLFINDIAIKEDYAYISVTNTGKIFKLDISNPNEITEDKLEEYATVIGANGLAIDGNKMYIASYPADGVTIPDNVIYVIDNLDAPMVEKLIDREGQYDGLAIHQDKLYFTNWINGEVGYIDLKTKAVELLDIEGVDITGPADITILNDTLYIPNLPSSELIVYSLK